MRPTGLYADDLLLALAIADDVDAFTLANFATGNLTVEVKADDTPVTAVDREAERTIRAALADARPHDAVAGEELGQHGDSRRRWIVDPIDGTKNFVRDIPVWATLIALLDGGRPVVGVVSAPALGKRWFAAAGDGAWEGRDADAARALAVSTRGTLGEGTLSYSSLSGWEERGMLPEFLTLTRAMWRTRAFGDFWSYMMVAEGLVEVAAEPELAVWDIAALVPIVEGSGGRFTSLAGQDGPFGGDAIASNGLVHAQALAILAAETN